MVKSKESIVLIGGGGHCSSVIDVIETEGRYSIAGIIDLKENIGKTNLGYTIIGSDEDLARITSEYKYFFITIGQIKSPERRIELFNILQNYKVTLPAIISPHSYVSKHSRIGDGTIIMHMAQVNANVKIGNNCIINSRALVEHDAAVGDHCHISTGAIINGGAVIGDSTFFGSGSVCREYITIPPRSFVRAGIFVK